MICGQLREKETSDKLSFHFRLFVLYSIYQIHNGDGHILVGAGIAVNAPDVVDQPGAVQEGVGDELGPQGVAGLPFLMPGRKENPRMRMQF